MAYWRKIATLMNPELLERLASTLDDRDPDAEAGDLHPQHVGQRFEPELRGVVRPDHVPGDPAADRADQHDAGLRVLRPSLPQGRQHGLGDRELADQIDLDLVSERIEGDVLQWGGHGHARVVH